jgi:hypothetical protein
MKTTKLSALFMTLSIVLSVAGFTYAHWADAIRIEGRMKMAHILIGIKSEKVLMSRYVQKQYQSYVEWERSSDEHTLEINSTNLGPCWYIWVGLVMQNQGPLPGQLKPPEYVFEDTYGFQDYFETKEYFYGPYPENTGFGKLEIWGKVDIEEDLLWDGTATFDTPSTPAPFPLEPAEKAVIWIWIHVLPDVPPTAIGKTVTLYINIVDDLAI